MLATLLLTLIACDGATPDTGLGDDTGPADDTGTSSADVETDVLIIGSGPAGLAAAWEAQDAGARVILLERDDAGGGAGWFAGNFFAVGTSWQNLLGIQDSVEVAMADWPLFTGGDGADPWVERLITESAEVLNWLIYEFGLEVTDVYQDPSSGTVPRVHIMGHPELRASVGPMVVDLADILWLDTQAESLVVTDGRVVGAVATDLLTGESLTISAGATVIATGGFARDLDAVLADRPDLAGLNVVFEAGPSSDGRGRPLLSQVDAATQNVGNFGVYMHSMADYRETFEGEALWIPNMSASLIVSVDGERPINEDETRSFHLSHRLGDLPEGRLYALYPQDVLSAGPVMSPSYNWAEEDVVDEFAVEDLVADGVVWQYETPAELAVDWGMDPDVIQATFDAYEAAAVDGADPLFNKNREDLVPFGDGPITMFELAPGAAKAFGGAELDQQARVLDLDGAPIPGLYAAGEVAGMLGTAAVGEGFTGSITACYLTGRVAGQSAAAEALSL